MSTDESPNQLVNDVDVIFHVELSRANREGFDRLLYQLLPFSTVGETQFLTAIWIVPAGEIRQYLDKLATENGHPGNYIAGDIYPKGIAIPISKENSLKCFILLDSSLVAILSPEHSHHYDTVSTLLEELLHVRLYGMRWQENGFIKDDTIPSCRNDLYVICSNFHDEFAVSALKTVIVGSLPIFEHEGKLVTGQVMFGESLEPKLTSTGKKLANHVLGGAMKLIPIADAYDLVLADIFRGIFEPLARDFGFRIANPDAPHPFSNAENSWFYRNHIKQFWLRIETELQQSIASNFSELPATVKRILEIVDEFLTYVGVSTTVTEEGKCWTTFTSDFFASILDQLEVGDEN